MTMQLVGDRMVGLEAMQEVLTALQQITGPAYALILMRMTTPDLPGGVGEGAGLLPGVATEAERVLGDTTAHADTDIWVDSR